MAYLTAIAAPVLGLAVALPAHYPDGFDTLGHLGLIHLATARVHRRRPTRTQTTAEITLRAGGGGEVAICRTCVPSNRVCPRSVTKFRFDCSPGGSHPYK